MKYFNHLSMLLDCDCSQQFAYKGAVNLAGRDCPFSFRMVVKYLLINMTQIQLEVEQVLGRGMHMALMPLLFFCLCQLLSCC